MHTRPLEHNGSYKELFGHFERRGMVMPPEDKDPALLPYLCAREMPAGDRGLLAGLRDAGSLAGCIERVIDDPALQARMEQNTRRQGKTTTWPRVAAQHAELLRKTAGQTQKEKVS